MNVRFHDEVPDELIKFVVIAARFQNRWVFCKHKSRDTLEFPGGHREMEEDIPTAAKRELFEETGAVQYELSPVCIYSVIGTNRVNPNGSETFGMLYYADIAEMNDLPNSEMECVLLSESLPKNWTYPEIQPVLLNKLIDCGYTAARPEADNSFCDKRF